MKNKKSGNIMKFGSSLIAVILLLTFMTTVSANTCTDVADVGVDSMAGGNITALIVGGPGYFVRVTNPKNVTIVAEVSVNITSSLAGNAEYSHELTISPGHSNIVYKIGGMPTCIFGQISAEVSVDSSVIASRSGFVIFGLVVIFTT